MNYLEDLERLLGVPEVVVMDAVVGRTEGHVVTIDRVELDTADVRLGK